MVTAEAEAHYTVYNRIHISGFYLHMAGSETRHVLLHLLQPRQARFLCGADVPIYICMTGFWARHMYETKAGPTRILYTVASAPVVTDSVSIQKFSLFLGQCIEYLNSHKLLH